MNRAAVITEISAPPSTGTVDEPVAEPGQVVVEMAAAALNPVDYAVANGLFYAGHPPPPYVPGIEAVGVARGGTHDGALVYAAGGGRGIARDGMARERFAIEEDLLIPLPDGADPGVACALGTAGLAGWLPLAWRVPVREGETVLVLGATGTAGTVAVQAARHLGAGRVVAAGRHPDRLDAVAALADATVSLDEPDVAAALSAACGEGGPTLIYDAVWGPPAVTALSIAPAGARLVQVGASAGAVAEIPSAFVRGKQTELIGYSNFAVPRDVTVTHYLTMVELAMKGELSVSVTSVPLDEVESAWAGLRRADAKYALVP